MKDLGKPPFFQIMPATVTVGIGRVVRRKGPAILKLQHLLSI